jgi:hypothetical protein
MDGSLDQLAHERLVTCPAVLQLGWPSDMRRLQPDRRPAPAQLAPVNRPYRSDIHLIKLHAGNVAIANQHAALAALHQQPLRHQSKASLRPEQQTAACIPRQVASVVVHRSENRIDGELPRAVGFDPQHDGRGLIQPDHLGPALPVSPFGFGSAARAGEFAT